MSLHSRTLSRQSSEARSRTTGYSSTIGMGSSDRQTSTPRPGSVGSREKATAWGHVLANRGMQCLRQTMARTEILGFDGAHRGIQEERAHAHTHAPTGKHRCTVSLQHTTTHRDKLKHSLFARLHLARAVVPPAQHLAPPAPCTCMLVAHHHAHDKYPAVVA